MSAIPKLNKAIGELERQSNANDLGHGEYVCRFCDARGQAEDSKMRALMTSCWEVKLPEAKPEPPISQAQINELWARLDRIEGKAVNV